MKKTFIRKITLLLVFILTLTSLGLTSVYADKAGTVAAPTNLSAASSGPNSVQISWNSVTGVNGYSLYRAASETGSYSLVSNTTSTSYTDEKLISGEIYYYKLRSYIRTKGKFVYSEYSTPIAAIPGAATQPALITTLATATTPTTTTPTTTAPTTPPTTTTTPTTTATTTTTTTATTATTTSTTTTPTTTATTTPTTTATTATTTTAPTTTPTTTPTTPPTTPSDTSLSVKTYGATGNGVTNDTAAIQRALNTGAPVISIPDGTYMIDALVSLRPKSNQTIRLSSNAVLKAIPNASGNYQIINISSVSNVEINGGLVEGDRNVHLGSSGEHGMGITIGGGTNDIRIKSMTIRNCWGDGIYVGAGSSSIARNVLIDNVVCDNNRRQGLSITQAEYVTVRNSVFKNTKGISPQSGLDIEPNSGCHVSNVTVKNCQFANNAGYGLVINGANGLSVNAVLIDSNHFSNNAAGLCISAAKASNISCVIPTGTTRINDNEFSQCYGLNKITIPSTVTSIGSGAFRACFNLASVTIPSSVTTIRLEAFKYCTSLTRVNIPASITTIGNWAFIGCSSLKTAYFYGNAPSTTNYLFLNCASDFKVYYIAGKTGFTSPTWRGYPAATFVP